MSLTITGQSSNSLVPQTMDQAVRLAEMMSRGKLVPNHLQASPGDCLMVVEMAMRFGMSPFAVAQCTSVIQGKLMLEGKLVAAALHGSGALATRLDYTYSGEGDARAVTVSATLAGENKIREMTIKLKDVKTSNQLWTKQPDQQLAYSGARNWARRFAPEVMLGVYSPEEMEAPQHRADDFAGTTISGTPDAAPQSRETINAAVPLAEAGASPPKRKTVQEWLDALEIELKAAQTIKMWGAIESGAEVQRALDTLKNGAKDRLKVMLGDTFVRLAGRATTPAPEDDGFPGVATPDDDRAVA